MNELVICSIAPFERHWERSYGTYRIPPGSKEKPSVLVVGDAKDKIITDLEADPIRYVMVDVKSEDIVNDLVGLEERKEGFFVIEAFDPSEQELQDALTAQLKWYASLVQMGDASWAQHGKHEHISDAQRRAAKVLGVTRPWNTIITENISCPGCGEMVPAHVAKCKNCHVIINREAYDKLDFGQTKEDLPTAPPPPSPDPSGSRAQEKPYEDLSEGKEA